MSTRTLFSISRSAVILMLGLFGSGCGGEGDELPREAISGTVTVDGKPFERGTIQFSPAKGNQGVAVQGGAMIEAGTYSIARGQGLVPGTYMVAIYSGGAKRSAKGQNGPATGGPAPSKEQIPAKYNSASKLTAEVKKGGPNEFTFALTVE